MTTNSANTTPIYPFKIIKWHTKLAAQVTPREITTETPVLLGTAGDNGSLIHSIEVLHLGDNVATVLRIYSQKTTDIDTQANNLYFLEIEHSLVATSDATNAAAIAKVIVTLPPILPSGQTGLHLTGGEKLYCSLGTAIASGVIVKAIGGNY